MAQGFWILSMFNHDPNYGDNTTCDLCKDVFDVRNSKHATIDHKYGAWWFCGSCWESVDSDDELVEKMTG